MAKERDYDRTPTPISAAELKKKVLRLAGQVRDFEIKVDSIFDEKFEGVTVGSQKNLEKCLNGIDAFLSALDQAIREERTEKITASSLPETSSKRPRKTEKNA